MNIGSVLDPLDIRKMFGNPAQDSMKYLSQVPSEISRYMGFYNDAGKAALPILNNQYGSLLSDPGGLMNRIGGSYQQSPGFQFALQQALQGAGNAAAAGGFAGSPMHEQQNMQLATGLANQDYNNWISNALGLYGRGLSGQENLYNTGASTGREMGNSMAQALMNQAMMSYAGNVGRNQTMGSLLGAGLGAFFGRG